jgi:hypothetical protein
LKLTVGAEAKLMNWPVTPWPVTLFVVVKLPPAAEKGPLKTYRVPE